MYPFHLFWRIHKFINANWSIYSLNRSVDIITISEYLNLNHMIKVIYDPGYYQRFKFYLFELQIDSPYVYIYTVYIDRNLKFASHPAHFLLVTN